MKNCPLHKYSFLTLIGLLLSAPSAYAEPGGTTEPPWATPIYVWDSPVQMSVQSLGQTIAAQTSILKSVATGNTDASTANNKSNINALVAAETAAAQSTAGYSFCQEVHSGGGALDDKQDGSNVAQAMNMAQGLRPDDPVTNANDIVAQCKQGFAPTSGPEASAYKSLCGGNVGNGAHQREDLTIEALLGPLQYPVPSALALSNGTYSLLDTTAIPAGFTFTISGNSEKEDYYQFVAAYRFCQHVTPKLPRPPQMSGTATVDALAIGEYADSEARSSVRSGACFDALERRMQYGKDVSNALQPRFKEQLARCVSDHGDNIIDDDEYAACQVHGRSELQADHDLAFRRSSHNFGKNYLAGASADTIKTIQDINMGGEVAFNLGLVSESAMVIQAISSEAVAGVPINQGLATPVK